MSKDQKQLINDLRRNQRSHTADRVECLGGVAFEIFKRDILMRFASEGLIAKA